jgi:hypothetical protein
LTKSYYAENVRFEDPLVKLDNFTGYSINIQLIRLLFDINFDLHDTSLLGADQVSARYGMRPP